MIVSVAVCPTVSVAGLSELAVRPEGSVVASDTVSGTFPTSCSVMAAVTGVPGTVFCSAGATEAVTPSTTGMRKKTVCVLVMVGSAMLVAVAENDTGVPGRGIFPVFGNR